MTQLGRVGELLGAVLHAQVEVSPQQRLQFLLELGVVLGAKFRGFHVSDSLN
jgi:hypothetical protein